MAGIKLIEIKTESQGIAYRVKSDTKSAAAQGGALGALAGLTATQVTVTLLGIAPSPMLDIGG